MPLIRPMLAVAVFAALAGAAAAQEPQHLECAGPFAKDATAESLASVFGAANVVNQTIDGPEGTTMEATLVFRTIRPAGWWSSGRTRPPGSVPPRS